jgi:hypothetical protein
MAHTESNEESPVALALKRWQRQYAGHVVVVEGFLLFAEVADDLGAILVTLAQYVEEKRLDVEEERLVVKKKLGEQTQILTI